MPERLLDAAAAQFLEKGFARTTMEAAQFPELVEIFSEGPGRAVRIVRFELERWHGEGRL